MIAPTPKAKIYYLPATELVPESPRASRWTALRQRLLRGWWRTRLSLADIRVGLWRAHRRRRDDDYLALLGEVIADMPAEVIDRRRRRPSRPAIVLDFETARARLRPQTT